MKYDPNKHHRRSIRLPGYDYSQPGSYFVTICLNVMGKDLQDLPRLGKISDGKIIPNEPGKMVEQIWYELPSFYPGVALDTFILMPDHIHGVIVLTGEGTMTLSEVVHRFKSLTTTKYRHGVRELDWTPFFNRFWQRNYYEKIIRNETTWQTVREYILNNPIAWELEPKHRQQYHPNP
ncbi:MAG: transposase [Geitlerinemataceae cyanobacterium]